MVLQNAANPVKGFNYLGRHLLKHTIKGRKIGSKNKRKCT